MPEQRVLMISVSAGSGHVRAAEALLETSQQFADVQAAHIDVMKTVSRSFRGVYSDFYRHLINHAPALWAYLYRKTDHAADSDISTVLRRLIERFGTRDLIRDVLAFQPDHIICTHFLPADLISREIAVGRLRSTLWVQVTDFDLHSLWIQPLVAGYFAANHEVAFKLRERGVPENRIHVTGIPVAPVFAQPLDRETCRAELGLQPGLLTALVLCGGNTTGSVPEITAHLLERNPTLQILALAGNNATVLAQTQQLASRYPGRLVATGYSRCIERLMAASDVVITKPGGLTSSECLIRELPMLLIDPIPGQEERNGDYLMERGAALKAHDIAGLDYKMRQLIAEPERLATMRSAMRSHARPNAARDVLTTVLHSDSSH
jgi:processive 1,2-diacylglycerol beta-glucosyltransferase